MGSSWPISSSVRSRSLCIAATASRPFAGPSPRPHESSFAHRYRKRNRYPCHSRPVDQNRRAHGIATLLTDQVHRGRWKRMMRKNPTWISHALSRRNSTLLLSSWNTTRSATTYPTVLHGNTNASPRQPIRPLHNAHIYLRVLDVLTQRLKQAQIIKEYKQGSSSLCTPC